MSPVSRVAAYSTTAIGTAFEHHAMCFLNTDLRMAVRRVGGRGDGGIDLRGYWWLPRGRTYKVKPGSLSARIDEVLDDAATSSSSSSSPSSSRAPPSPVFFKPPGIKRTGVPDAAKIKQYRIIAQCKAERKTLGPKYVRELEGTLGGLDVLYTASLESSSVRSRTRALSRLPPLLGILFSQSGFSEAAMRHASKSATPLLLIHLPGGHPSDAEQDPRESDGEEVETETEDNTASTSTNKTRTTTTTTHSRGPGRAGKTRQAALGPGEHDYGPPPTMDVGALWWNTKLAELLPGNVELRREVSLTDGTTRVGMWYFGGRMGHYGPTEE